MKKQSYIFDDSEHELIAQFTAFMTSVVRSAKIDYIRRQRHWNREISMDVLPEAPVDLQWFEALSETGFDFEEERLSRAFSELPVLRQRILEMVFVKRLSAQEIAQRLNCSVKYIYNQKHAALKKLRDILLKGGDEN